MVNIKKCIILIFVALSISMCAWQQNPTPATMDNSIYNQDSLNIVLHSVSQALDSQLLSRESTEDTYTLVYAIKLNGKPAAISMISTNKNNKYFMQLMESSDISAHLFGRETDIIHSDTLISKIKYSEITNQTAKTYLKSLGFTEKNNFIKRITYFTREDQTLILTDYLFPNLKTNSFDINP